MPSAKPKPDAVLGLALLLLTLGIRLPLWSLPPFTDEGTWLAVAYLSPWQTVLHPNTPLGLCAHLLSWLVGPGASSFAVARVADALFAGTAAWLFFLVLRQRLDLLSAGLAAALWVVAFNQPRFIDAGMKNPVAMAATCLMAALWLLGSRRRWAPAAAGVLMGLAIGLREPFVFFLLTSAGLAWRLGHGRRALAWHLLAAAGTVLAIVWIAGRGQGGVAGVVAYYQGTTHLYAELRALDSMSRPQRFGRFALESFQLTRWLVLPAAAGALALLSRRVRGRLGEAGLLALLLLVPEIGRAHV